MAPDADTPGGGRPPARQDARDSVAPLERGLAVLRAVCANPREAVRPGELVRETALARSTVDRVLSTLIYLGYLRTDGREVSLAPRAMQFGDAYLAAHGLREALEPHATRLADGLDESVSVAVPDRDGARFVVQIPRRRTMMASFHVGDLLPAERCAPGSLFAPHWSPDQRARWRRRLAGEGPSPVFAIPSPMPAGPGPGAIESAFDARAAAAVEAGWALDDQLVEPGLIALAVPIREAAGGRVVAALSVVSHTSRHSPASLRDHALDRLRETAGFMERDLAARSQPPATRRRERRISAVDGEPLPAALPIDEPKRDLGPLYLRSLARGLAVLVALGGAGGGMTLSAVAEATGLPRATARRALITLCEQGYVSCVDPEGRLFVPAPSVLELGYARLCARGVEEVVRPHLLRLSAQVHESASVAVLRGPQIAYVARVAASRIMQVAITVGTRLPAYATSMGRVLLAGLDEPEREARITAAELRALTPFTVTDPQLLAGILRRVAVDGYALVDQELEEGLRSMAAPIRDHRGRVVAAVNVSMHAGRVDARRAREMILPALTETAARISADVAAMGDRLYLETT